ncbi:MAG TPA: alpha/beta hydrolase, partial [Blastocatellia bacterium]
AFSLARLYAGVVLPPDALYATEGIAFEKFEAKCFQENVNRRTSKSVSDAFCNVDLSNDVAGLKCPTLLLIGSESRLNDQKSFANVSFEKLIAGFRQLNPKAEVAAIPDSGNSYCMITKPEETARIVIDFLSRLDR